MKKIPTIGFLSQFDPRDKRVSSGTSFKMAKELSKLGNLKWIPIELTSMGRNLARVEKFSKQFLHRNIMVRMTCLGASLSYKAIPTESFEDCDVIVAFFCSDKLANLKIDKPVIYFTDATFPAMIDYSPDFSHLPAFNRRQGTNLERRAVHNAAMTVFSSDLARNSAIKDLGANEQNTCVVEFGPNIDSEDIKSTVRTINKGEKLRILFQGVNWVRKGGDIAVSACKWLNENGVNATLTIVGIKELPTEYAGLSFVENLGFLNKNNPAEYALLTETIDSSHLLLLPTLNECSAVSFVEAAAFGLPVITHDTGGTANYVIDDFNGYCLSIGSKGEDFGRVIKAIVTENNLETMSQNAIRLYKEKLNYERWRRQITAIIEALVKK